MLLHYRCSHYNVCLRTKFSLFRVFSFCGNHVCAPFVCMFLLLGHISLAWKYKVWQFNSCNGHVKEKFPYLCTSSCCSLWNTLLVKLCILWNDGATAGNSLENCFPEYLAVTLSRCVGCQEYQQIFVPLGHFLILERAKNSRGLSQVNTVDGPFL
jgi:hypothetical protein